MNSLPDEPASPSEMPRWVQVPVGLVLGAFTLLVLGGSLVMILGANEKAPVLAPLLGVVWTFGACWILEKCVRLVFGWKSHGGLMGQWALRAVGVLFLLFPVAGLFTGYFAAHPFQAGLQTLAYIALFLGLNALAQKRPTSYDRFTRSCWSPVTSTLDVTRNT